MSTPEELATLAWHHYRRGADAIRAAIEAAREEEREAAKAIYRELHSGDCRLLSQGEACRCFLCRVDERKK